MYQDLSFMDEVDPLHGYAVGDKVQWIEKDTAYLMKGLISGESELETEWGRCIKVQFGKSCYDVLPTSISSRALNHCKVIEDGSV